MLCWAIKWVESYIWGLLGQAGHRWVVNNCVVHHFFFFYSVFLYGTYLNQALTFLPFSILSHILLRGSKWAAVWCLALCQVKPQQIPMSTELEKRIKTLGRNSPNCLFYLSNHKHHKLWDTTFCSSAVLVFRVQYSLKKHNPLRLLHYIYSYIK